MSPDEGISAREAVARVIAGTLWRCPGAENVVPDEVHYRVADAVLAWRAEADFHRPTASVEADQPRGLRPLAPEVITDWPGQARSDEEIALEFATRMRQATRGQFVPDAEWMIVHARWLEGMADRAARYAASVEAGPSRGASAPPTPEGIIARDCPFCGHEPAIENLRSATPVYPIAMRIRCSDCAASAGVVMGTDHDAVLLKAWAQWDRRFSPQADAKAIPSPAPQAPPPEGLNEDWLLPDDIKVMAFERHAAAGIAFDSPSMEHAAPYEVWSVIRWAFGRTTR